jgi:hypothetical protein
VISGCLELLKYLSALANQSGLNAELERAAGYNDAFWDASSLIEADLHAPFPFISTLLAVGAHFIPGEGYHAFTEPLPFNYVFRDMDNDDGYTVVDISDLNNIKFGFVYHPDENLEPSICTAKRYLQLYNEEMKSPSSETLLRQLRGWKVINEQSLTSLRLSKELNVRVESGDANSSSGTDFESILEGKRKRKPGLKGPQKLPKKAKIHYSNDQEVSAEPLIASESRCLQATSTFDQFHAYRHAFATLVSVSQPPTSSSVSQIIFMSYVIELSSFGEERVQPESIPWSKLRQKNAHSPEHPLVACVFPMADIELSPTQLLQGLHTFVKYLTNRPLASSSAGEVAMVAAKSFAMADGQLDDSQPSHQIRPLPATLYSHATSMHHKPQGRPPMIRNLENGQWTLILAHEALYDLLDSDRNKEKFRYAFVAPQRGYQGPPPAAGWVTLETPEIADVGQFLHDTAGSQTSLTTIAQTRLVEYWTSHAKTPKIELCEKLEVHEIMQAMTVYSERSLSRSPFYKTIQSGNFLRSTDTEIVRQIYEEFPLEFDQLKNIPGHQPCLTESSLDESPSRSLYEVDHDAVNSTLKSILALRWLQKSTKSRHWPFIYETQYLYPLVVLLIAINLAKDPRSLEGYCDRTGISREGVRHNDILLGVLKGECPDMITCLKRLNFGALNDISEALQLDLKKDLDLKRGVPGIPVFRLHIMAQILDHTGGTLGRTFDGIYSEEPIPLYRKIYYVGTQIITGKMTTENGHPLLRNYCAGLR